MTREVDREWRRWDLNPQPRDYDALALPLSYLAKRRVCYYGLDYLSTIHGSISEARQRHVGHWDCRSDNKPGRSERLAMTACGWMGRSPSSRCSTRRVIQTL